LKFGIALLSKSGAKVVTVSVFSKKKRRFLQYFLFLFDFWPLSGAVFLLQRVGFRRFSFPEQALAGQIVAAFLQKSLA
jgi:hypothetical protein